MVVKQNQIGLEYFCSFYVSDWHMVTMLLPYINEQINQEVKIATIFEKEIENKVEELLEKINVKNKEKIKEIDWKMKNGYKYDTVKEILKQMRKSKKISNYLWNNRFY